MKHLVKNFAVLGISILFLLLSIKSTYAAEDYSLKSITATSTKTVELELDKKVNKSFIKSDLEIYKSIKNKSSKIENEENKVLLELSSTIEKNTNYSLISLSVIEGNIIFKTGDDILLKEINNNDLENGNQGIKSILIKDSTHLVLTFVENIDTTDLDFQLLKTLEIKSIFTLSESSKIKATLEGELNNNTKYLGTLSYLQTNSLDKINISKGINYFTTGELAKYEGPSDVEKTSLKTNSKTSLEEQLIKKLSEANTGTGANIELEKELNSASQDPANQEKTQLEKLALSQGKTPDTGAETWVLLMLTFIINTFYFISRRKKVNIA